MDGLQSWANLELKRRNEEDTHEGFTKKSIKCFMCEGPHMIRDCPKWNFLNAMVSQDEGEEEEMRVSSMRLLNSLKAKDEMEKAPNEDNTKGSGLMFVEIKVDGVDIKAFIDTGASHNFISEEEATKMGITYTKGWDWMKAVTSSLQLGGWENIVDLTVVPMDDYRMVLGMEFVDKAKPFSFGKDQTMHITKWSTIHIVPLER
ncbi:hypothetical protein LIER_27636 [Lithospermum erythrorhizon]|uniref:Uncharacterized protein n=1 Tax=Lithospermum erythrorhizon TaxID=34254 RepID=A0AAV3RCQ3_LITER